MELQGINRYPVLNPAGAQLQRPPHNKRAPVRHFNPHTAQDTQPHYVNLATNMLPPPIGLYAPVQTPVQKLPGYEAHPYPQFAPVDNRGLRTRHPQQYPQQHPPVIGRGALYPNQTPVQQHYQPSGEYYQEVSFSQQPEGQELAAKYVELEKQSQNFKCVSYIHKAVKFLSAFGVVGITIALIWAHFFFDELCYDVSRALCVIPLWELQQNENGETEIALLVLMFCGFVYFFHSYALKVYLQRRANAMNCLHIVYIVLLAVNVPTLQLISIAMFGYLVHASSKLKIIFKEMEEIKTQLEAQGVNVKSLSTTPTLTA